MASLAALARTRPEPSIRVPPRTALPGGFDPTLGPDAGEALGEAEVAELASRLLDARSDAERDHLLAATLTHAAHRAGGALTVPLGSTLGGMLKAVALRNLAGPRPGQALGLELEGLEADERAFEAAQQFVRLAGEAARHAVEDPVLNPRRAARAALAAASHVYAPGLLPALTAAAEHRLRERDWVRDGQGHVTPAATLAIAPFDYDPEMEYFLSGIVKSASRAARAAVRTVSRATSNVARTVDKAASAVGRIPVVGDVARAGLNATRLGLGPAAIAIDAGARVARGENFGSALRGAVKGQIDAAREQLKLAEMVAPFVPGIGTGVAAALGAANALAAGRPITDALVAAARSAVPGGAVAQAAFDVAVNLAKGKNITEAALAAARDRLPGGPAARAAFDGALALAQGKRLQDVAFAAAGRVLPPSPFAADALDFVQRVANGQNVQHAALSVAGQRALRQIQGRATLAAVPIPGAAQSVFRSATRMARTVSTGRDAVRGVQRSLQVGPAKMAARGVRTALPHREMELFPGLNGADGREFQEITRPRRAQPGGWVGNLNAGSGKKADRIYQRQITGRPTYLDYRVERGPTAANFDGYKHGVLLDAKNLPQHGGVVRMWEWMRQNQASPPERLRAWAEQQVEEAQRQVKVAGDVPIVWHVSSANGARVLRQLLDTHGLLSKGGKKGIAIKTTLPQPRPQPG